MASNNILKTRLVNKHDIEANWLKATGFIPLDGEIIVYEADETCAYPRFKVGDGATNVNDLPFAESPTQVDWNQNDENAPDYVKNRTHFYGRGLVPIIQANGGGKDYGVGLMEYRGVLPVGEFELFEEGVTYTISCNGVSDTIVGTSSTILSAEASKLPNISANTNITLFAVNAYGYTRDYHIRVEGGNSDDVWTVAKESDVIVPLDEKYIPSTIARVSDIPEAVTVDPTLTIEGAAADAKATGDTFVKSIADWNETDETSLAFIKNKPTEETEDDALEMLTEMGILDPIQDEENNILTDEDGNIFTIE